MERVFTSLVARYKSERLFWSTDQKNWTTRRQHLVDIWPERRWKRFADQSNVKMHPHVSYDRSCTAPAVVPTDYRRDGSLLVAGVFWKEHAKPEESMPERTDETRTRQRGPPRLRRQIHVDRPVQPCHCVHLPLSVELTAVRVMRTRRPASVKVAVAGAAAPLFSKFCGSARTKPRSSQSRCAFPAVRTVKKCRPWVSDRARADRNF
jgi:hypothetical protein